MAYYVHLLASDRNGTLPLGVTNDRPARLWAQEQARPWLYATIRCRTPCLVWCIWRSDQRHRPRERNQEMASRLEIAADRRIESAVARSLWTSRAV